MSVLTRQRIHGYLIGGITGISIGMIIDSVDLEALKSRSDKLLEVCATISLVVTSVLGAYHEPRPSSRNHENRQTGSRPDSQD